jgi:hypothetical protein
MRAVLLPVSFFFTLCSLIAYGQSGGEWNNKPITVKHIGADEVFNAKVKRPNLIKINLWNMIHGEFLVSYERRLGRYFGAEIAAGLTYILPTTDPPDAEISIVSTGFGTGEGYPGIGKCFRLGGRFYPNGSHYPIYYIGADLRNRVYNLGYHPIVNDVTSEKMEYLKKAYTDYYLVGGIRFQRRKALFLETDLGLGVRKRSFEYLYRNYDQPSEPYQIIPYVEGSVSATLGVKVGVAF